MPAVVVPGVPQLIIVKHLFSTGFQLEVFTHVVMMLHDAWRLLKKKIGERGRGGRRGFTTDENLNLGRSAPGKSAIARMSFQSPEIVQIGVN